MPDNICAEQTFENVFRTHGQYLRNFLYYKSGDLALAEDLVQDAFIKLWENCHKVTIEKAKSYLFTIGQNLFLNKIDRRKVQFKFQAQHRETRSVEAPDFLMEEEEFKQQLQEGIAQLPEGQRVVFLMNRIDQKTYKEIAESLSISVKAVEKRMHKALVQLRKIHRKV